MGGAPSGPAGARYGVVKRSLDVGLSALLLVLLAPVLLLLAAVIRLDSRGPALFRQERIGLGGVPFMIYKFRTMRVDSPSFGPKPANLDDDRVTRLGRFLRRASLDEFPQLFNVLRGEMSLVGPRPEQSFLVRDYAPWQWERLRVLPGMTGWWQVNGRKQPMHEYVEEDIYYVRHRSFCFDMWILLRTVRVLLGGC